MSEMVDISGVVNEELAGLAELFARRSWDGSVDMSVGIDDTDDEEE